MLIVVEVDRGTLIYEGEWIDAFDGPEEQRRNETLTLVLPGSVDPDSPTWTYVAEYGRHMAYGPSVNSSWVVESSVPVEHRRAIISLCSEIPAEFEEPVLIQEFGMPSTAELDKRESRRTIDIDRAKFDPRRLCLSALLGQLPLPFVPEWFTSNPLGVVVSAVQLPTRTCMGQTRILDRKEPGLRSVMLADPDTLKSVCPE